MRIVGLLMASVLLGVAAIGAWLYFGPDGALPLAEKAAPSPERSKVRYAPYVVLVPAEPLPGSSQAAKKPARETPRSSEAVEPSSRTKMVAREPEPPLAPAVPAKEPERKSPASDVAKQALDAILGADKKPAAIPPADIQAKAPPQPSSLVEPTPPAVQETPPSPAPEPVPIAKPKPAAPEPEKQSEEANRATTKLKYEIETDRQAKAREKQKSLLAKGTVRFRRVIPVGPGRIKAGQNIVLLAGVDALGADAQCTYSTGTKWDCGKWGTFALRRFIRSRSVVCDLIDEISPSEMTGRCKVGGADISKWIIRRGWGMPTPETQSAYSGDLEAAKTDKLGQWSAAPKSDS